MPDVSVQEQANVENLLTARNIIMLVSAVMVACVYDFLFFGQSVGVSYPLFFLLMYIVLYTNTPGFFAGRGLFCWFFGLLATALSMTFVFFTNDVLGIINSFVIPVVFTAHVILVTERNRYHWFQWRFMYDIYLMLLLNPIKYAIKPFLLLLAMLQASGGRYSSAKKAAVGAVLSLPVLVLAVLLLASADPVFGHLVGQIMGNINFAIIFPHVRLISAIIVLVFGYLWGLNREKAALGPTSGTPAKLDEMMIIPGLFLLNAIYVIFVCIQFSYLFGSIANFLPEGLTYAEYARRGFFELIMVSLINAVIVLGSLRFTLISGALFHRMLQLLNSMLLLSTLVMLLSAHTRMSLYEYYFGYTYLRVFTHAFMGMLFVVLAITLLKVWIEKINLAKWYIIIGLTSYMIINYINVDVLIAQKNMQRYGETGKIDVAYLAGMSYDATPYLAMLSGDPNPAVATAASKALIQRRAELTVNKRWSSYNMSKQRARTFLTETAQGL